MNNTINPAQAANIYARSSGEGNMNNVGGIGGVAEPKGNSFGDILKTTARNTIDTLRAGERASAKAVEGDASLPEVVQAVTASEITLQTVVAIRDRLVTAYQEILRMPV